MNRRSFVKKLSMTAGAPFVLNGLPISALASHGHLQRMAAESTNDKVLVIIQMHGGNDGLNTLIPVDQYSRYYNLRPNIAISDSGKRGYVALDSTLPLQDQVGLHPDMIGVKEMYDRGEVSIIQGVAYENINGSHFRSRDIWFMGGGYNEELNSGWMGRYLDDLYPNYPQNYPNSNMPDPLGIEVGNSVSLAFHRANGIPTAISISDPDQFYNLVTSVGVDPPAEIAETHYGDELRWIMDIEEKSNQYAGRLQEVYSRGSNTDDVIYPEKYPYNAPIKSTKNHLATQLRMIARLLSGGSQTKIFLARIGGFDTHADQVEQYDSSMGNHAAILYHVSEAVKAFQDDLKGLGLDERVLTATMSEFGRRAESNFSWGTDHGTSAPMFVFGSKVNPGVMGTNPDLDDLDRGNLRSQHDYRQVFGSILQDWMGASPEVMNIARFTDFVQPHNKLNILGGDTITGLDRENFINQRFRLETCFPNPSRGLTNFSYRINHAGRVSLTLLNVHGQVVKKIVDGHQYPNAYSYQVDVSELTPGTYLYRLETQGFQDTKKLVVY